VYTFCQAAHSSVGVGDCFASEVTVLHGLVNFIRELLRDKWSSLEPDTLAYLAELVRYGQILGNVGNMEGNRRRFFSDSMDGNRGRLFSDVESLLPGQE